MDACVLGLPGRQILQQLPGRPEELEVRLRGDPTTWPKPDSVVRSQFTQQQIDDIEDAVVDRVRPTSDTLVPETAYELDYYYDGENDRIVVRIDAPASVTDQLRTTYPDQLEIKAPVSTEPSDKCAPENRTAGETPEPAPVPASGLNDDRSDLQWQQLKALRDYNCALAAFEDPTIGPVLIFPKDRSDLTVANPTDWASSFGEKPADWPVPTTARSVQFTVAQIRNVESAVMGQLSPDAVDDGAKSKRYGILITNSSITSSAAADTFFLGQPWHNTTTAQPQAVIRDSSLPAAITAAQPWTDMTPDYSWKSARFSEYHNSGPGAGVNANRPQLTPTQAGDCTPRKYLAGTDGWNPTW
ncbi:hypothetical protein ACQEWB_48645 [Streptomyces sp. CA-249302]|uniref:hypothetical protein n=1 Tax=Streptomyces sp. CA-249302 TaxID=3240058 RepID=UPI003D8C1E3B